MSGQGSAAPDAPVISGGVGDPYSAYLVDVDAVLNAAARYHATAELVRDQGRRLQEIALDLASPLRPSAVAPLLGLRIGVTALRLLQRARDREDLAERVKRAVYVYRAADEEGRARWRSHQEEYGYLLGLPDAHALERDGLCTTAKGWEGIDTQAPCPGPADGRSFPSLYTAQEVVMGTPQVIDSGREPGVSGLLGVVADAGDATVDGVEADAIDVQKRTYVDESGQTRESYVVAIPGTSGWDVIDYRDHDRVRTLRPNLEGAGGAASAEARLVPEVLKAAGVPPGAEVLLVGHSQGGMTAMAAAALPAMRGYRVQVLTGGSPVGRMPEIPGVRYTHLQNRGDAVPHLDQTPNRRSRGQVTVTMGEKRGSVLDAHSLDRYQENGADLDENPPDDPGWQEHMDALERSGHLATGENEEFTTTRVPIHRVN
ncbi:MAG: alpha/beta fold hydrolase [Mobilicoccus sp.]|nr:alpha/beta fold hydrolase [Mobilicoccus sp.]